MSKDTVFKNADEMKDEIIDFTKELLRIPSRNPPGEYEAVAKCIADKMREIGFEVEIVRSKPGKPNLIGRIKGTVGKPVLIYSVHMDTVPEGEGWTVPPFGAVAKEGKIFGRGALDAKGRITVYTMAAEAIKKAGTRLKGDLILAMTVDEETGSEDGAKYLVEGGFLRGDMAICEWCQDTILTGGTGYRALEITTFGEHGAAKTVNAIAKMARLVTELYDFGEKLKKRKSRVPDIGWTKVNVARISSTGPRVTWFEDEITADRCTMEVQLSVIPEMNGNDVVKDVMDIIKKLKKQDPDFKAEVKTLLSFDGWATSPGSSLLKTISKVAKQFGMKPKPAGIVGRAAASDCRFYQKVVKEVVQWGVGTPDCGFHQPDEFIRIDDLVKMTNVHAALITQLLGAEA